LRLLSVHLKSGCFDAPLENGGACTKLAAQVPILERWIDEREREGAALLVLGDFNRKLFAKSDQVWNDLQDADPASLKLWSPTALLKSKCRDGKYPDFIDHLLMNERFQNLMVPRSFVEHLYDQGDAPYVLSDHCPLSVDLDAALSGRATAPPSLPVETGAPTSEPDAPPLPPGAPATEHSASTQDQKIKGNISGAGRKLYHLPGCPGYEATKIDAAKGERFFDTEAQARAAGWVKAGNCR